MADIKQVTIGEETYNLKDVVARSSIAFGQVDSTSTATAYTATIPGITSYYDGLAIMLKNGVVTSAAGFTIDINGLGAKQSYNNMAAATADTTLFNINYTMLFVYDSTRVSGGGWICYRGYDANTNTIGYQLRTNSRTRAVTDQTGRYRLLFSSADDSKWVPANSSSSTSATAAKTVIATPINPWGEIAYYSATTVLSANTNVGTGSLWSQYIVTFGYSFNRTGAALVMTYPASVYVKCAPQTNGSAVIDSTEPYVQALPSTKDGKIYIYLGTAYSATNIELVNWHPVFYHDGNGIKFWTGSTIPTKTSDLTNDSGFITTETDPTVPSWAKASSKPTYTASEVGAVPEDTRALKINTSTTGESLSDIYGWDVFNVTGISGVSLRYGSGGANDIMLPDLPAVEAASQQIIAMIPTATSDLTNDSGFITTETDPTVPAWAKAQSKPTYTATEVGALPSNTTYVSTVNGQSGAVTITEPLIIQGTLSFYLTSTHGTGTFTPTSGDVTKIPTEDEVYIIGDIHTFSSLSEDKVVLRKMRKASSGMGIVMFNGSFKTASGVVYVEVEGEPDDEYDWNYATWSVRYVILQEKLSSYVESFNGNSGAVTFSETDPTVPSWAKASSKPTYTATEVGALPSNTTYVSTVNGQSGAVTVVEPLVVTITLNPSATTTATMFSADKTYAEISAAVEDGVPCVAIYSGYVYPFSGWYGSSLNFTYEYFTHSATNGRKVLTWQTIRINSSDVVSGLGYYDGAQITQSPQSTYLTVNLPVSAGTQGQMLVANAAGTGLSWQNQPTIPTKTSDLTNDSGFLTSYTETDPTVPAWAKASSKPTYTAAEVGALPDSTVIPAAQVNSDWNASSGVAQILNKPTIPTVPTTVSSFTNDAGYLTLATLPIYDGTVV